MSERIKLTAGQRAVLATLVEYPQTTVIALAEAACVGKSSAAAALRLLEQHGLAARTVHPPEDGKPRPADFWSATREAGTALIALDAPETRDPDVERPHLGQPDGDGSSSNAVDALRNEPASATTSESAPIGAVGSADPGPMAARLGKGALREAVLQYLQDHPDATFTPTALSKALVKSSGAISNALDVLVAKSEAVMVCEKPRTFRAAGPVS